MPFTLSHPAAVLPLRRLWHCHFDFSALVIGSLTPDFGYYIQRFDVASLAHSFIGSFFICLPFGILLLVAFHLTRRSVCFLLPSPHRQALMPLCSSSRSFNFRRLALILLCLLIGAWSHIVWDSFTHENGWFVERVDWLHRPLFAISGISFPAYYVLQQLSTIAGCVILVVTYLFWLRRLESYNLTEPANDSWRYILWIAIIVIASLIAIPMATRTAGSFHGYAAFRVFVFRAGVYFISAAVPLMILVSSIVYARRPIA